MAEQDSIFGLNFNPELQNNEEDFKKALLGQAPTTPVEAGNNFLNMAGLPIVGQQAQPLGPQSPILPSGEKAVYAMTPEELAARQAARGGMENASMTNTAVQMVGGLFGGGGGGISSLPTSFTPPSAGATPSEEAQDISPLTLQSIGLESPQQVMMRQRAMGLPTQQSEEAITMPPTALSEITPDTRSGVAANTVMAAPEPSSEQIESAQPRLTTVGGASLSEFLGGEAMPEQGFARAEREMAGRGITLTPEQFNELSAQREARIGGGGATATERDTSRAESRVTSSQNIPTDVREAMNTPAGRLTRDQIKRLTDWQGSTQGQAYIAEQEAAEAEANKPFEPREVEIGGNNYIQLGPNNYQPVRKETPTEPKKSAIESLREEGVKAGLPENLIRQSIASRLGLDLFNEEVMNWMAGNTDTMPSVEGESETSALISNTIPTITSQEQYDALESGQTYIDSQGVRAVKK